MSVARPTALACLASVLLVSCGAPPLKLYVLAGAAIPSGSQAVNGATTVVEVARIALPGYLDTEDIVLRRGSALETSHLGRWASRLSLGATDSVTGRLAERRPDALITDQPQTVTPSYRLLINIGRLDVTTEGVATLEADWLIVPRDPAIPTQRDRGVFHAVGATTTDGDVVALEQSVLDQLAAAIDLDGMRHQNASQTDPAEQKSFVSFSKRSAF